MGGGTGCRLEHLPPLYRKQRPLIVPNVSRNKSLALFQVFFSNPGTTYLKGSYLETYTLGQPPEK
jgi:tRNA(adenine34) deaminase